MAHVKIDVGTNRVSVVVPDEFAQVLIWMCEERGYQERKFKYDELDEQHALEGLGDESWYWTKGVLNYTGRVRLFGVTSPAGVQSLLKLGSTILSMPEHLLRGKHVRRLPYGGVPSGELR
jgi:hypothetical protein